MYPLLWLSLAFLSGLLLAAGWHLPPVIWGGLAFLCLALIYVERRIRAIFPGSERHLSICPLPVMLAASFVFLGATRGALGAHTTTPVEVEYYTGSAVRVTGWVSAPPDPPGHPAVLRVAVEALEVIGPEEMVREIRPVRGQVSVRLAEGTSARYGDRLDLSGELQPPPVAAGFSYREYLARQGVYSQLAGMVTLQPLEGRRGNGLLRGLYGLRERAWATAARIFPQPEAALLSGIVLGLDRSIPRSLQQAFQTTGTAHIIAISGFNITILAGLFFRIFGRMVSRWWALLAAILATTAYTLFVGAEPPVMRAALMGSLALFGREIGRSSAGLNTLGLTAALMSLFNPNLPFDPSFQLSFFATLGMVLYAEPFQNGFRRLAGRRLSAEAVDRLAGPVGEYFLTTLAAQITTLPVMAVHFGRLPLISLLANPLVLPPQPAVMVLSGLAICFGMIWLPAGQALAWVAWPFAAYTVRMVELLARIPAAAIPLENTGWWAASAFYAALFILPFVRQRWSLIKVQLKPALLPAALGAVAVLAAVYATGLPDGRLHMWVINPKGEACVLVKTPGGNFILLGAPNPEAFLPELDARLPLFRRKVDLWLVTASGERLPDLTEVAEHLNLDRAAAPPDLWNTESGAALEGALIEAGNYTAGLAAGQVWDLGGGERLRVLAVSHSGAALLLEWKTFRALLPGGLSPQEVTDDALSRKPALLVLPSAQDGWQELDPQLTVHSGEGRTGINILRLQERQWLHAVTDGRQIWLESGED